MVLLTLRFRFRQESVHSDEWAICCDPPVFAAPGWKMSLQVASLAFTFCAEEESNEKDTDGQRSCTE